MRKDDFEKTLEEYVETQVLFRSIKPGNLV